MGWVVPPSNIMVNLIKLVEMNAVPEADVNMAQCTNEECAHYGVFDNCYLHTYVWCEMFDKFYNEKYGL